MTKTEKVISESPDKAASFLWVRIKVYAIETRKPYYMTKGGAAKFKGVERKKRETEIFEELALILSWAIGIPEHKIRMDAGEK